MHTPSYPTGTLNPPRPQTSHLGEIRDRLQDHGFLSYPGAFGLVDGQFGSTGKGLAAALLANLFPLNVDVVTSNAGPNSGHTSYYKGEKIVLKQLPTFSVVAKKMGYNVRTYLNAGAVIDPETLYGELVEHDMFANTSVNPHAARIEGHHLDTDVATTQRIGSTGKGMGPAIAQKIMRQPDAVYGYDAPNWARLEPNPEWLLHRQVALVEVSQGYSLGINAGFYPYCTARDCTIGAALSDAQIHPSFLHDTMMVVRTYPIRVAGTSGDGYRDQEETTWDGIGQEPELTTVTKKVRRVFTWSDIQFRKAVAANRPGVIFLNFCNYLGKSEVPDFVRDHIEGPYSEVMGVAPPVILLGYGPRVEDVRLWK